MAEGHLGALKKLADFKSGLSDMMGASEDSGFHVYNLGIGDSVTVMDMVATMEKASGLKVETRMARRRPGEPAEVYLDSSKAEAEMGWKATLDLQKMCADLWRWQNLNPQGYKKDPSKAAFGAFKTSSFKADRPKLSSMSGTDHEDIGKIGSAAFHRRSRDSRSFIASGNVAKDPRKKTSKDAKKNLTQLDPASMRGRGLSMDALPTNGGGGGGGGGSVEGEAGTSEDDLGSIMGSSIPEELQSNAGDDAADIESLEENDEAENGDARAHKNLYGRGDIGGKNVANMC